MLPRLMLRKNKQIAPKKKQANKFDLKLTTYNKKLHDYSPNIVNIEI